MPKYDDDDYEVGYGKPPKEHQFKPGQSGNPSGRPPKEAINPAEVFEEIYMVREKVVINGKEEYLSKLELIYLKILEQALKSNRYYDRKLVLELMKLFKIQDRLPDF